MDLVFGQRYERSAGESPEAFLGRLAEFLEGRLAGLPIELGLGDGDTVVGAVDSITPAALTLEGGDESLSAPFQQRTLPRSS
jgi:hypothetical protein